MEILALLISIIALLATLNLYRSGSKFAKSYQDSLEYIYNVFDHTASRLYKAETDLINKVLPDTKLSSKKAAPAKKVAAKKTAKKVAPRKR